MSHLTRDELTRFWRDGNGDRDRIVGHLAVCDACGALYGEVIDAEPLAVSVTVPVRLADRGRRAYRIANRSERRWWRAAVPVAAAAAAVALAVVLVPRARTAEPMPVEAETPALRGAGLQALTPDGEAAAPLTFRWASALHAAAYRVEVRIVDGETLIEWTGASEWIAPPAEELSKLPREQPLAWRVVALDIDGEPLTSSQWRRFVVAARAP